MRALVGILVALGIASSVTVAPVAAQWTEVPGTRLDQARSPSGSILVPDMPRGGTSGTALSIVSAWNSAAIDTDMGRLLLVRHGGHADTAHNGVLSLDLSTHRWSLLRPPSTAYPQIPPSTEFGPTYADGSPASVHIYDCEAYLPGVRRVYSGGGIYWSAAGESSPSVVWWWNPATNAYERRQDRPGGYGCASVWDPIAHRLLLRLKLQWASYDPSTDRYTTLRSLNARDSSVQSGLFLDAAGRKVYGFDKRSTAEAPGIRMLDLTDPSRGEQRLLTEGDTAIETVSGVGGVYIGGRIIAYGPSADGVRGAAYTLIPNGCGRTGQPKCRWMRWDPPSGPTPPRPDSHGMWKRVFMRGGNLHVLTSARENLWTFRIPWDLTASPPLPPPPPPTAPPPVPNPLPSPTPTPTPAPGTPGGPVGGSPSPTPLPSPTPGGPLPSPTPPSPPAPPPFPTGTPFTATAPIPNTDLRARWNGIPLWARGHGPMAGGGKHARLTYDTRRRRFLLTGGDRDGSDNGNPSVWAFTVGGPATQLSPMCRPYPDYLPSFPDNVSWVYDSRRDRAIVMPGFFFPFDRVRAVCGRNDERILKRTLPDGRVIKEAGSLNLTTNKWEFPTWPYPTEMGYGGDQGTNFSAYDPTRDMIVRFHWDGAWGNNLQRLHLATNTWDRIKLGMDHPTDRNRIRNQWSTTSQPAIDVQGRAVYVISRSGLGVVQPDGTSRTVVEWRLLRVNLDTGAAQRLPVPAGYVPPNFANGNGTDILLVFDPVRRVLIHPHMTGLAGDTIAVYISHVDAGHRWSTVPIPRNGPPFKGNVAGVDPNSGAMVLIGGHASTRSDGSRTPTPTHYWTLTLERG